jgi:hypothetical protein
MSDKTRDKFTMPQESIPRYSLLVTSRNAERIFGGVPVSEIVPLKISGPSLAGFLDFCLRGLGVRDEVEEVFLRAVPILQSSLANPTFPRYWWRFTRNCLFRQKLGRDCHFRRWGTLAICFGNT